MSIANRLVLTLQAIKSLISNLPRSAALVGVVFGLAASACTQPAHPVEAASSLRGGTLSENCYSDTHCLIGQITRNAGAVNPDHLNLFVDYLVRLEQFDLARVSAKRIDSLSLIGKIDLQNANQEITVQQVATDSWRSPDKIVSLVPLEQLAEQADVGRLHPDQYLFLLVDVIIHRSLWAPMESHLSDIFRPKMVLRSKNATLTAILESKWPQAIGTLEPAVQATAWNELARSRLELGEAARAEEALQEADKVDAALSVQRISSQTWRTWMDLGDYPRALQAAGRASEASDRAFFRLQVAQAMVNAGRDDQARAVIAAALPDVTIAQNANRMGMLLEAVDELIDAGDTADAHSAAAQMATLAHQRQILPADALAMAATAANDLGDHQQADALLTEALAKAPGSGQVVGVGVTLGPITGATLGLAASLRSEIAEQLYRAGNQNGFETQLRSLPAEEQAQTWSELCDPVWRRQTPPEAACVKGAGPAILLRRGVDAAARADTATSVRYLSRTIQAYRNGEVDRSVDRLLDCARLAVIDGRKDLMNEAMIAAARAADHLADPSNRELGLAEVAALRKELAT